MNEYTSNLLVRVYSFLKVIPTYFSIIFSPTNLHMERSYEFGFAKEFLDPGVLGGTLILATIAAIGIFLWRRKHYAPAFGIAWFLVTLIPISGIIVPVAGIIYEHYLYMPMIGLAFALGCGLKHLYESSETRNRRLLAASGILVFATLIPLTALRNTEWKNEKIFFLSTLADVPTSNRVWDNLAMLYFTEGKYREAARALETSLKLNPYVPQGHYYLGLAYEKLGAFAAAEQEYIIASKLAPGVSQPLETLRNLKNNKK